MADSKSERDVASDLLIQEVDEDLRRDQYMLLWKQYGAYVIAGVVVLVLAVAGYQGYRQWQAGRETADAAAFGQAQALVLAGKAEDAEAAFAKLGAEGHTGYTLVAQMNQAALLTRDNKPKDAIAVYDKIAVGNGPELLRQLAVVKEALVALTADQDLSAIKPRVDALAVSGNPWYYQAVETQALIARKTGDQARALALFKQLSDDAQAPQGTRTRAAEMIQALGPADGKPAVPAPPGAPAASPSSAPPAPAAPAAPAPAAAPAKAPN